MTTALIEVARVVLAPLRREEILRVLLAVERPRASRVLVIEGCHIDAEDIGETHAERHCRCRRDLDIGAVDLLIACQPGEGPSIHRHAQARGDLAPEVVRDEVMRAKRRAANRPSRPSTTRYS